MNEDKPKVFATIKWSYDDDEFNIIRNFNEALKVIGYKFQTSTEKQEDCWMLDLVEIK